MATVREISARFTASIGNLQKSFKQVESQAQSMKDTTQKASSGMQKSFDNAGKKVEKSGQKVTDAGDKVNGFGKKWSKASGVVTGAVAGMGSAVFGLTNKVTANADAIADQAKTMNVSAEAYQELAYWGEENGVAQGQVEKAVGRLNQRMGKAVKGNEKYADAMKRLGINMKDVENGTLSTEDAFAQSIQTLSQMDNETEKAELATEMFGTKMARDLLPALEEGSLSLEDAKKEAHDLGIVMSDDQIEASANFQKSWGKIKNSLKGATQQMAMKVLPYMQDFLDWVNQNLPAIQDKFGSVFDYVSDKVKTVVNWFQKLSPTAQKVIGVLSGLGVAIGPVAMALGTFLKVVGPLVKKVGRFIPKITKIGSAFGMLSNPIGIAVGVIGGLATAFTIAYKKSETFRNFIGKVINKAKQLATRVKPLIMNAINSVVGFFKDIGGQLVQFWNENKNTIGQALQNIWTVVQPILNGILSLFKAVFPAALTIVKSVWGNIKGVIQGALDIIMGLVKTFSGLFTGNFSKMWEGVKQIFSGAVKFVWNFIQLQFFGKIVKGAKLLLKSFTGVIKSMWSGIKTIFMNVIKAIVNFFKKRFTAMKNTGKAIMKGIGNIISKIWNGIKRLFTKVITAIVNFVKKRFSTMKNRISGIFNGIKKIASTVWDKIKGFIIDPIKSAVKWGLDKFHSFKKSVSDIFNRIKESVSDKVGSMIQFIKDMPGKMKRAIDKGRNALKNGFLTLMSRAVDGVASGVNGVISAINWALRHLGMEDKQIDDWTSYKGWGWYKYAKGTKGGHPEDGPAIVGDGKGSNAGRELITKPNGEQLLSPSKPTMIPMEKGTQVTSAKDTKKLFNTPAYADGIWGSIKSGVSSGASWVADKTKAGAEKVKEGAKWAGGKVMDGFDWVKGKAMNGAKYLYDKAVDAIGLGVPPGGDMLKDMIKGGFTTVKDNSLEWLKDKVKIFQDEQSGPDITGDASAWADTIRRAATMTGTSVSDRDVQNVIAQIQLESGGNQKTVQSPDVWDVNMAQGNPARGLLQYIPGTFNAYKVPGYGNIMNGFHQLMAFFNNKNWRSDNPAGASGWGPSGATKFANGGTAMQKQLAWLADGGWAETVISHDPAKKLQQEKIWQQTGDKLGFETKENNENNPTEINQNVTINSAKHLSPSEISKKNAQQLRRLAMDWGFR